MLNSDKLDNFKGVIENERMGKRMGYEDAVKTVQEKVKNLTIGGSTEIQYGNNREYEINFTSSGGNFLTLEWLSLRLSKGQIATLLESNPQSASAVIENMIELEGYVEQAFKEGLITWEQKNLVIAMATFSDEVDPHKGLDILRTLLQRHEWMEFLRNTDYVTKELQSELSRISPIEGLIVLVKIFRSTKEFNIVWDKQELEFNTISRFVGEHSNRL